MFRSNIIYIRVLLGWTVKNTDIILMIHLVESLELSAFNRAFYNNSSRRVRQSYKMGID